MMIADHDKKSETIQIPMDHIPSQDSQTLSYSTQDADRLTRSQDVKIDDTPGRKRRRSRSSDDDRRNRRSGSSDSYDRRRSSGRRKRSRSNSSDDDKRYKKRRLSRRNSHSSESSDDRIKRKRNNPRKFNAEMDNLKVKYSKRIQRYVVGGDALKDVKAEKMKWLKSELDNNIEYISKILESFLNVKLYDQKNENHTEFSIYLLNSAIESIRQRSNLRPPTIIDFDNEILNKVPQVEIENKEDKSKSLRHIASLFSTYTKKNSDSPQIRNLIVNTLLNSARQSIDLCENPPENTEIPTNNNTPITEKKKKKPIVPTQTIDEKLLQEKVLNNVLNFISQKYDIKLEALNEIVKEKKMKYLDTIIMK